MLLIQRCRQYSSDRSDKMNAIHVLQALLEQRAIGGVTSQQVLVHVRAELNAPADNPIFAAPWWKSSTVKQRFEEARDLMLTLQ